MPRGATVAVIPREQAIAERVRPISDYKRSTLVGMSQREKRAIIDNSHNVQRISSLLQVFGRNVVRSIDRFFEMPHFWWFRAQKSFMLVHSLEWMKAAGLVEYFLEQIDVDKTKGFINYAKDLAQQEQSESRDDGYDGAAAGVFDSVVFESFVLLLYGTVCSLIAVAFEFFVRHVMALFT